jgi:O-antigen/teichoic acid export membrane protein
MRMGGWMSASGILTQALLYADRFLIGALLTLTAVAFYATPLDLVMRMWILPVAIAQAMMPAMASSYLSHPAIAAGLLRRGALLMMLGTLPACLLLVAAGPWLLELWLGAEFAAGGGRVLQILAVGVFFSCVVFAPSGLIDSIGHPKVNAIWQLVQMAVFLPLSAVLLVWIGIEGAAAAWAARCAVDAAGRMVLAGRLFPPAAAAARALALPLAVGGAGLAAMLPFTAAPALAAIGLLTLVSFALAIPAVLTPSERRNARGLLRRPWRLRAVLKGEPE